VGSTVFEQKRKPRPSVRRPAPWVDTITLTISEEMARNENILVFGQDVADCSREENLKEVKGKAEIFKATQGLQHDVWFRASVNAPIAEAAIVGRASGMAMRGIKPVWRFSSSTHLAGDDADSR